MTKPRKPKMPETIKRFGKMVRDHNTRLQKLETAVFSNSNKPTPTAAGMVLDGSIVAEFTGTIVPPATFTAERDSPQELTIQEIAALITGLDTITWTKVKTSFKLIELPGVDGIIKLPSDGVYICLWNLIVRGANGFKTDAPVAMGRVGLIDDVASFLGTNVSTPIVGFAFSTSNDGAIIGTGHNIAVGARVIPYAISTPEAVPYQEVASATVVFKIMRLIEGR